MFVDRSDRVRPQAAFKGYGVAVTPGVNGPCAFVAGHGCANRLYTWRDGRLRDVAPRPLADDGSHAVGVAAGDVDADGREELYVHDTDSYEGETTDTDRLLDPVGDPADDPDGRWRDLFGREINAGRDNFRAGRSVAVLDRYGTGRYGVAVANHGEPSRFYEVGEDGEISDMAAEVGIRVADRGRSLLAGPIVSDRTDLFVGVQNGPNRLFRNEGGHFTEVAAEMGVDAPDVNARGVTLSNELLAVCSWEGPNQLFRPADAVGVETGDGVDTEVSEATGWRADGGWFEDCTPAVFAEPSRVRTVVATDFDNDGRDELFVNALGTANRLFRHHDTPDGPRLESIDPGPAAEPRGLGTGAAVADFDGDGVRELLVVHGEVEPRPVSLYAVADPGDRFVRVRPLTSAGAPARGAAVVLETDEWRHRRIVCAGSGYLCQMEPVAHFGLGDATPERLTVQWPDGRTETVTDPAVGRAYELDHPAG
ncbi:CRTAC1 family protein [Halobaculum sp. MBLA0143]|uniref:CRTAC1 family protein n=1 Tax=Halobaculum sp. MBLA0143 TaxID=3079933 RepID=UPI003524BF04